MNILSSIKRLSDDFLCYSFKTLGDQPGSRNKMANFVVVLISRERRCMLGVKGRLY